MPSGRRRQRLPPANRVRLPGQVGRFVMEAQVTSRPAGLQEGATARPISRSLSHLKKKAGLFLSLSLGCLASFIHSHRLIIYDTMNLYVNSKDFICLIHECLSYIQQQLYHLQKHI